MQLDLILEDADVLTMDPRRPRASRVGIWRGVVGMAGHGLEGVQRDHRLEAGAQAAGVEGSLVGGELQRAVADPPAGDPRVRHGGDALGRVLGGRTLEAGPDVLEGLRLHEPGDEVHGGLVQQAGGAAGVVDGDPPALGLLHHGLAHAGPREHRAGHGQ